MSRRSENIQAHEKSAKLGVVITTHRSYGLTISTNMLVNTPPPPQKPRVGKQFMGGGGGMKKKSKRDICHEKKEQKNGNGK
jgi:hypothetical protein